MSDIIAYKWQLTIQKEQLDQLDFLVEDLMASMDVAFDDDRPEQADISLFFEAAENMQSQKEACMRIGQQLNLSAEIVFEPVYLENWQAKAYEDMPPIEVGAFYVYQNLEVEKPTDKICIHIPAQMAFGTGSHATTEGCLKLFQELVKTGAPLHKVMDMGAGTAILSIAASLFVENLDVYAVDIDPDAIVIALENAQKHKVSLKAAAGDGFKTPLCVQNAPYDLIFANILKNPLLIMKDDLYDQLQAGGYAIISGFDETQQQEVLDAYQNLGFSCITTVTKDAWVAALLRK